jgi:PAS domain S-box-containing protein
VPPSKDAKDLATSSSDPLALLTEIAAIANEPSASELLLPQAMAAICRHTSFTVGHVYVVSGDVATSTRIWHVDDAVRAAPFRAVSESTSLRDGESAVGRALRSGLPVWIDDIRRQTGFTRAEAAKAAGLRTTVAVPLLAGHEVPAVLELFGPAPLPLDLELRGLLQAVGIQLGRIFEREQAGEHMRNEWERQRLLLESSTDAVFIGGPTGEVVDANPAACRLLGRALEEIIGLRPKDFAAPEWEDFVDRSVAAKFGRESESSHYEYVVVDKAGARIPVEVTSTVLYEGDRIVGVQALLRDLRESQRAQRALRESEERFRGAFEAAPIGMALTSIDGRWLKVNDAFCEIVGYTAAELLTMSFQEITHPDDLAEDVSLGGLVVAGELPSLQLDKRFVRKDGSPVWTHLSVSVIRAEDGSPAYSVAQILDIDERKRRELGEAAPGGGPGPLSPREREVLSLLAEGRTSAEVGVLLGVSEETVQTHVRRAMTKLEARSRTQAVASAIRLGWLDGDERNAAAA